MVMNRTVQMAKANGVGIGALPGFPDLPGFGRRNMDCTAKEHKVMAVDGTPIGLNAQALCVHGDTPVAVDLVRSIKELLESEGVAVKPMGPDASGSLPTNSPLS